MIEFLLDTDMISIIQQGQGKDFEQLMIALGRHRLHTAVTTVSLEEQFRGWFAVGQRARDANSYVLFSERLLKTHRFYSAFPLRGFDANAAPIWTSLRKQFPRLGTMDLRIAAIALSLNAILVTRNSRDFAGITLLKIVDWTKPSQPSKSH